MSKDRFLVSTTDTVLPEMEGVRTQFGALCFRTRGGEVQTLLITSRTTKRWVPPKGWPMEGRSAVEAAAQEAWEEAGVRGRASGQCLGIYSYLKLADEGDVPCVVALFPMKVSGLAKDFPERRERRRKWFSLKKAAAKVDEPELAQLILDFDPRQYFS